MPVALIPALVRFDGFFMTDRTKLMVASLAMMMLPYRVEFMLAVLVLAAIGSVAYLSTKTIWRGSNDQVLSAGRVVLWPRFVLGDIKNGVLTHVAC